MYTYTVLYNILTENTRPESIMYVLYIQYVHKVCTSHVYYDCKHTSQSVSKKKVLGLDIILKQTPLQFHIHTYCMLYICTVYSMETVLINCKVCA